MKRRLFFVYGVVCHLLFLATYAWMACFVGNVHVPISIDSHPGGSIAASVAIDLALILLFGLQHSVMARPTFKRVWTRLIPEPIERSTYVLLSCVAIGVLMWQWRAIDLVVWDAPAGFPRAALWTLFAIGWLMVPGARSRVLRYASVAASAVSVALAGGLVIASARLADNYSTREIYRAWETAQATVSGPLLFEQHRVVPSLLFYSDGNAQSDVHEDDETVTHYDVYTSKQTALFQGQPPECASARVIVARIRDYVLVQEVGLPNHCDLD
jgi:hypothetical protein